MIHTHTRGSKRNSDKRLLPGKFWLTQRVVRMNKKYSLYISLYILWDSIEEGNSAISFCFFKFMQTIFVFCRLHVSFFFIRHHRRSGTRGWNFNLFPGKPVFLKKRIQFFAVWKQGSTKFELKSFEKSCQEKLFWFWHILMNKLCPTNKTDAYILPEPCVLHSNNNSSLSSINQSVSILIDVSFDD